MIKKQGVLLISFEYNFSFLSLQCFKVHARNSKSGQQNSVINKTALSLKKKMTRVLFGSKSDQYMKPYCACTLIFCPKISC
jgi:hypothetical protein